MNCDITYNKTLPILWKTVRMICMLIKHHIAFSRISYDLNSIQSLIFVIFQTYRTAKTEHFSTGVFTVSIALILVENLF